MTALRLWVCPDGHAFQARDDEDPDVWRPVCKRCTPGKAGEARSFMDLVEYVPQRDADPVARALEQAIVDMVGIAGDSTPEAQEFMRETGRPRALAAWGKYVDQYHPEGGPT